jgi:hypothetical protein
MAEQQAADRLRTGQAAFRHRNLLVSTITQSYYAVLNEDPEGVGFPAALAELNSQVEMLVPIVEATRQRRADLLALLPWKLKPWFSDFAAKWYLPRKRGPKDVWDSLVWWHSGRVWARPEEPMEALRLSILSGGWVSTVARATITPPPIESFTYDITVDSPSSIRARVRTIVAAIERNMADQVEAFEREHGHKSTWVEMPPQYRDPELILRAARRLYRWNLAAWTWARIAKGDVVSPGAVTRSVNNLAMTIDVPVRIGSSGAPKKRPESTILP